MVESGEKRRKIILGQRTRERERRCVVLGFFNRVSLLRQWKPVLYLWFHVISSINLSLDHNPKDLAMELIRDFKLSELTAIPIWIWFMNEEKSVVDSCCK